MDSTTVMRVLARVVKPLASRKVRVAFATVLAAYAADYGLNCSEGLLLTVVSVGVAMILGIAHEDNGAKAGSRVLPNGDFVVPDESNQPPKVQT